MARHMAKFYGVILLNSKVMCAITLNFKPIFDPYCKKCKGDPRLQ